VLCPLVLHLAVAWQHINNVDCKKDLEGELEGFQKQTPLGQIGQLVDCWFSYSASDLDLELQRAS